MKLLKSLLLAAIPTLALNKVTAQTADEVLVSYQKAIGTADVWNKITSMKLTGTMNMQGMDINLIQTMLPGKAMRTDISIMGLSGYTIVTRSKGWIYMPFQPGMEKLDTMKADALIAAQSQLDLPGKQLLDYKNNGIKVDYAGKDTVNKMLCHKIKCIDKAGNESFNYLDAKTYYLLRTESKLKQDDQEQEVTVGYDNYKKLEEGITMPMTVSAGGGEITFKTVEFNKPIDEAVFIPTEAKADKESKTKK